MDRQDSARRLLLVHAHPDDESIGTGATIARYAAEGAQVTLVTCTRGELGEVIPPELAYLSEDGDRLAEYRITELATACAALGIDDQRFLGGPGRWRDSGMMGLPDNDEPSSFWQADVDEAARELVAVITEVRPQVVVTYDENGFYGHPDHIQAHRVAWRAFQLAPWRAAKFYATADGAGDRVTTEIDGTRYLDAKIAAMRAHATQIAVATPFFALSNKVRRRIMGHEYYTLLAGERGAAAGPQGREDDLFAGLG